MALLDKQNNYIKLELNEEGLSAIFYKNKESRDIAKNAIYGWKQILAWYDEELEKKYAIMHSLITQVYKLEPNSEGFLPDYSDKPDLVLAVKEYWDLYDERFSFYSNVSSKDVSQGFIYPLIALLKGIPEKDILSAIPRDIGAMIITVPEKIDTVNDAYGYVKRVRVFGETADV